VFEQGTCTQKVGTSDDGAHSTKAVSYEDIMTFLKQLKQRLDVKWKGTSRNSRSSLIRDWKQLKNVWKHWIHYRNKGTVMWKRVQKASKLTNMRMLNPTRNLSQN